MQPREFHLIETMRLQEDGLIKSLAAHLDRAARSACFFGFTFDAARIREGFATVSAGGTLRPARIRLLLYQNGDFAFDISELPSSSRPMILAIHPDPLDTSTCWSRHKTSLRDPYDRRIASIPSADDVIVQNEHGDIMETCTGNLAVRVKNIWVTPPLASGCLPGIERQRLLLKGALREQNVTLRSLQESDGVAVINSLRGWRAVAR
ncbi:MAG: aminotransferase class IV [Rhodococcus sp. (in: high G+C Gram-positive bacteria)]